MDAGKQQGAILATHYIRMFPQSSKKPIREQKVPYRERRNFNDFNFSSKKLERYVGAMQFY